MRITRRPATSGIAALEDSAGIAPAPTFAPPLKRPHDRSGGNGDSVEVSHGARLRQRLRTDIGDLAETDASRVATLRARVAADAYRPSPGAVAKSLVGELAADLVV